MPAKHRHQHTLGGPSKAPAAPAAAPVVKNESLLATDEEKLATSKSLYGDHKARIASNLHHVHDTVRMNAYLHPIQQCMRGKTVLHLGCGMGLLSMLAARAMAKQVVAVDTSIIVHAAAEVATQNKLSNLTFVRGSVKDGTAKLPFEKFDVILCEWMGIFINNETELLQELIHCKKNHLVESGVVCPNKATLQVAGITDYQYKTDTVEYWENVYGFKMSAMKPLVRAEPTACSIPRHMLKTNLTDAITATIDDLVLKADDKCSPESLVLEGAFELRAQGKGTLHYLTFFVNCEFSNEENPDSSFILGSTPGGQNCWTEVSAMLPESLPVFAGDVITGTVKITPHGQVTDLAITTKCKNKLVDHDTSSLQHFQY